MNWMILLEAASEGTESLFQEYGFFIVLGLMAVVFYFLMIRPQKKQKQQHIQMLGMLRKNDKVVTIGGIHGTVISVKDDHVIIKISENSEVNIRINRSAIGGVVSGDEDSAE